MSDFSKHPRWARWISWFPISITRHLITFTIWMEFHKPLPGTDDEKDDASWP